MVHHDGFRQGSEGQAAGADRPADSGRRDGHRRRGEVDDHRDDGQEPQALGRHGHPASQTGHRDEAVSVYSVEVPRMTENFGITMVFKILQKGR